MLLLETAQSVSLTQDVWLGHTSCVSVCAHFILNWRLRTVFLAGRYFVDADPSESLHQLLTEALSQYGLADKVAHAAVYGAAGVVRSFQTCLPGFSACEDGAALPGVAGALPGAEGDWRPPPLDSKGPFCLEGLGCFAEALQLCVAEGLQDDLCLEAAVNKVSTLRLGIFRVPTVLRSLREKARVQGSKKKKKGGGSVAERVNTPLFGSPQSEC